jgi:hypothetical protein
MLPNERLPQYDDSNTTLTTQRFSRQHARQKLPNLRDHKGLRQNEQGRFATLAGAAGGRFSLQIRGLVV